MNGNTCRLKLIRHRPPLRQTRDFNGDAVQTIQPNRQLAHDRRRSANLQISHKQQDLPRHKTNLPRTPARFCRCDACVTARAQASVAGISDIFEPIDADQPIFFYVPAHAWTIDVPSSSAEFWPAWCNSGNAYAGAYAWTLLTYLHLRERHFSCELKREMPERGIVVSHRDWLPIIRPNPNLLLVNLKADRRSHPYAQLEIVQTPEELEPPSALRMTHVIRHWPQPSLIPRDPARGDRFEHAAFIGYPEQLAPELKSSKWTSALADLGIRWSIIPITRWHDFSDIDVIVAARHLDGTVTSNRPASKLYNAWLANIPALLGPEAAFRRERRSDLDYIEITSLSGAIEAIRRLCDNPNLRNQMIANGHQRSFEFHPDRITAEWEDFFTNIARPILRRWNTASPLQRRVYFFNRNLWRIKEKLHRGYSKITRPGRRR
jgi:hypothetical protein